MPFFGRQTVLADLRLHKQQAGLVTSGTLNMQGGASVSYSNVCVWPIQEVSGLGQEMAAHQQTTLRAWRTGETQGPRADDTWTVAGKIYNVMSVVPSHNHDESSNYAIYDCLVTRKG